MQKKMGYVVALAGLLMALDSRASAAIPAFESWCVAPLEKWTEVRTLDTCKEAMPPGGVLARIFSDPFPTPPFGSWQEVGGELQANGLANCWSTMLLPGDRKGASVTVRLTVDKSCGAERQLPGGCMRWGFHWGENMPGWDVGVVLGYQDPLNLYRLQISAARGEMALWDATGGFLQLIPCAFELGKPYDLTIRWKEGHLIAELDGKPVMDYWDRSLPYTRGRVGLAVWNSAVRVERFTVANPPWRMGSMPAHKPDFRFEPSRNLMSGNPLVSSSEPQEGLVLFDGYEPICYFWKQMPENGGGVYSGALFHEAVKLKPGWRPAYYNTIGPNGLNYVWKWPMLVGNLPEAFKVTETGEKLAFAFQTETPGTGRTDYACSVTYDNPRGVYRYEFSGTLKLTADARVNEFELSDPLTYNNRSPGPEVVHRWNPSGHRWWVYQGTNGLWERMPLTDCPNDYNTDINNAKTKWGKIADFLYPDPAACPLFETELKWPQPQGRIFSAGQCSWGYDFHHREMMGGAILKAGDERSFVLTFTALPPAEAKPLFEQSQLMACIQNEKRLLIPFIPTGATFAVTTTWQDPSATMVWLGGVRDETTGHGDSYSLRLEGPGKTTVTLYHYMIEPVAKRWWVRGWIKTNGLKDPGLRLRLAYPSDIPMAQNDFMLGAGVCEWTYFSVITDVFGFRDITHMTFNLAGEGQAWLDDVAVSALADDQNPMTTTETQAPAGGGK